MDKTKILIVEDERLAAEDLRSRLEKYGCQVIGIAATGKQAIDLAQEQKPEIILMDINLRGKLDGIETSRLIHEQQQVPILFATAFGDEAHISKALEIADPYGFLHKPVQEQSARTMIKIALARFEKDQQLLRVNQLLEIKDQLFPIIQRAPELPVYVEEIGSVLAASLLFKYSWTILYASGDVPAVEAWNGLTKSQENACRKALMERGKPSSDICEVEQALTGLLPGDAHSIPISFDDTMYGEYGFVCHNSMAAGSYGIAILRDISQAIGQGVYNQIIFRINQEAQKKIAESEDHLKAIVEKSTTGIYLINDNHKFEYVNKRLCEIFGRSEEEIIGHNFEEFLGDSKEMVLERYQARLRGEDVPNEYEIDIVRPNGFKRDLIISVSTFHDAQGNIKNTGHLLDITDQKRLNLDLTKLSQAVEQSPVMTVITDANGTIEYVNNEFTRVTGYTYDEAIGQNPRILKSGQHDQKFYKEMWDTIKSGKIWTGDLTNKMKDGSIKWEKVSIAPIRNQSNTITHFVALKEDITEHKLEQEKAARNQVLKDIQYEIAAAAIKSKDVSSLYEKVYHFISRIISSSNFFMAILNKKDERIYFPFDRDLFDVEMPESIPFDPKSSLTAKVISNGETLHLKSEDIYHFIETGEITLAGDIPSVWLGIPLKVDDDVFGAFVLQEYAGITQYKDEDVRILDLAAAQVAQAIDRARKDHELRMLAEELGRANGMKELLLDVITHDLRNPAGVISSIAEMLEMEDSENELFEIMKNSSDSLMKVIENATVLSKLSLGETISKEPLDLVALLHEIATEFESQLDTAAMDIILELPSEKIIEANHIISEIPKNYISNAIKYASEGKTVTVKLEEEEQSLVLRVEDRGTPIPEDKREAIFQRSVQLEKGKKRGRGLGLAIVKRIAEAHGARVGVEEAQTGGNSFYLKF